MPSPFTPSLRAAIFDMDGLLINSEPLWQQAEIHCFRPLGVPLTEALCRAQAGRRLDEILIEWHQQFGWQGPGLEEMHRRIIDEVTRLILAEGSALPGVFDTMASLQKAGLKLAIASSSPPALIDAVVDKLGIRGHLELTHSGVDEAKGKPDPAIFLTTARRLGVDPEQCLVFEDAPAGVIAAHRAGMMVVAVPSVVAMDHPDLQLADLILNSLEDFRLEHFLARASGF